MSMFKKKENEFGMLETIVGPESTFLGTIKSKNSVRIDGKLEGGVAEATGVIVGEKGQVQGDLNARIVIVGGKITGNITAMQSLEILSKAQVYGDLHTASLSIGEGAIFEGNCVMATEKDKVIDIDIEHTNTRRR
ncbi:MAG: polymer-forming cytoskeletal protein [Elusimicrobia bacterium]|nr:polymer-forming cytoskeletal protein [Candidatus Liberimonas magnetica]